MSQANLTIRSCNLVESVKEKKGEKAEYITFSVGVNRGKDVQPDFYNFICFDKYSIERVRNKEKGHPLYVEAHLRHYKDKDGVIKEQKVATYVRPWERLAKDDATDEEEVVEHIDDPEVDLSEDRED